MKIENYTEIENVEDIVDRDDDIKTIIDLLNQIEKSQVYIVYSNTGYGKSTFSTKLSKNDFFSDWNVIQIKTIPKNKESNVPEGNYLDLIFKAANDYFKDINDNRFMFVNYIISGKNKLLEKLALNETIDKLDLSAPINKNLSNFGGALSKRLFRIGTFDYNMLERGDSIISRSIKADYIHYIFENTRVLLIIDNIQNIDNMSYKFLLDWINDTKNQKHGFIFEFTISDKHSEDELDFLQRSFSQTGADIYKCELEQMKVEYIPEIIDSHLKVHPSDIHFTINVIKHYNEHSYGNLWDLINYARVYDDNPKHDKELPDPTLSILQKLCCEAKYIVSILYLHSGIIDRLLLEYIWPKYFSNKPFEFLEKLYISLISTKTIKIKRNENTDIIMISHASILDVWKSGDSNFTAIDKVTQKKLEDFYNDNYCEKINVVDKQFSWQMLIRIYAINKPDKIIELLDDFKLNVMKTISRENTWNYLNLLIQNTQNKIFELKSVYFKILKICCLASLYNEGYYCIQLMEEKLDIEKNDDLLLNKLLFLSILDEHNTVIELYKKALNRTEIYSSTWIKLKLMVLCSYIALGNSSECWKIDKELKRIHGFKHKNEYPIYLRLTNIYKKPSKCIYNSKKSVKIFRKLKDYRQEGKSLITYSKLLSSLGRHKKAIEMIMRAKNLLEGTNEGMSCIYNNLAGYLLLSGEHGEEVLNYLDIAEIYSVSTYDKLSVVLNKLAWCYENNSFIRLDLLENKALELIELEPSKFIHCTIYYNLYVVMKKAGFEDKANKYFLCAVELKDKCSCIKARINGITWKTRYLKPRIKKPYHICYLSFWVFDI